MDYSWDYKDLGGTFLVWVNEVPMVSACVSDLEKAPEELLWLLSVKWHEEAKDKNGSFRGATSTSKPLASVQNVSRKQKKRRF